jgi:serine/threonine protein kinase/beta-lactam-binding protein with PASTA domain|nr:Stk1 family PASTA domain-containing Ser/Thr kinase [uncultured Oscillibacter sp.]
MDQYIGKMLDNRYEILERIGTGGMAVVYKAKCHRLNRLVAVKILKSDLAQDEDFRRRFNAEAAAVAQLSHPNIVSVYDVSRGGDTEYIVMELIDGITLKQYMEKRGQLNWRESLHFITQIMRGLSHAHSRGIVHRDIKPQNVMVLRDGSVKVADFGIACLENSAQTLTQEALGSVHYISPEQARGDRTDARSDIYSAGVVLYEMLTGRLPFEGDSAVSVAIQHLSSIPLAPREINPDIPEQLELICMKSMAPDLDRRYPSADAMIADLEAFRKNPGVSLDFELEDLRPEESDEPTRPLRTASILSGSNGQSGHRPARESERERRRYDDYDDDYDRPRRGSNKRNTALIGVAVVLAVAVIVVLFRTILGSFGAAPTSYVVPDLLGCTEEEAKDLPEIKDIFKIAVQGTEFSDKYEKGEICRQDPEEGEERQGDNLVIKVWVSDGEDTGEMINVVGQSQRGAETLLKNLADKYDLTIEAPEDLMVYNDEVEAGCVISSDPAEGETLHKGDTITLVLSKGKQPIPLINFVGVQLETALGQLEGLGLNPDDVTVTDEYSDKPVGEIIRQTPDAGAEVQPGDKITFVVSKGPENGGEAGTGSTTVTIPLPTDREQAYLELYQDGRLIYEGEVDCTVGSFTREIEGSGSSKVEAYVDNQRYWSETVTFDGN